jgi:hypothetical protein
MGAIELVDEEGQMVERAPGVLVAMLIKCPRTLYDLWKEYIFGFAGHKPAKDFTRSERGAVLSVYSTRNHVWQQVAKMVRSGYTADRAIDKIYSVYVYGHSTAVTNIIKM